MDTNRRKLLAIVILQHKLQARRRRRSWVHKINQAIVSLPYLHSFSVNSGMLRGNLNKALLPVGVFRSDRQLT
uniref:Uncharacterized protein n=1 Tax=Anguilla anguilla TaxID=7936 RepID=A0A0E9WFL5_ANGAN